jgi:hypothetical protein
VRGDPLVQAVLARFPGAEIVDVRTPPSERTDLPPLDASGDFGEPDGTDEEL